MGPLAGLRVVEFAHIMAGPVTGLMLADMGADVIKVEKVPGGDDSRRFAPPTLAGESAAYLMMNRNKRGIAIDLKAPAGLEVAVALCDGADVVIENYRLGTMDKLGLGWPTLQARNTRLVYCSLSGFGRSGPYAERGGFDLVAQGMSGLMSITGEGPGRPPVKCGPPVTDITAGILAAMGILGALFHRQTTGLGQCVDTSLFEAGIVHTYWQSAIAFATGVAPGAMGSAHPLNAPYQAFPTADGWINVGAANQANWEKLIAALEQPALGADARFASNDCRMQHLCELVEELTPYFRARTTGDWLARFQAAGLPAGPVLDVRQMHADPQTRARRMVVDTEHPLLGTVPTLGHPVKYSATPAEIRRAAPLFGQHSREILAELGYRAERVEALLAEGAVISA